MDTSIFRPPGSAREFADHLRDARAHTLALVGDLTPEQMLVPKLKIVNPPLWELGHVAWFAEQWVLRHFHGQPPIMEEADRLYNSAAIEHDLRWELNLPVIRQTLDYMQAVNERIYRRLENHEPDQSEAYFLMLALHHEDMHDEAFTYTRQTLSYCAPSLPLLPEGARDSSARARAASAGVAVPVARGAARTTRVAGDDCEIGGGDHRIGAEHMSGFVFDNEKWAHEVRLAPYCIARHAATMGEFAEFVDAGGYARREWWSDDGWRWRSAARAEHPLYWERRGNEWFYRHFDAWQPIGARLPVVHVNWYEADAFCRFAGRRLPSEAEWEVAACGARSQRSRFPWGDEAPSEACAHLDFRNLGPVPVDAPGIDEQRAACIQMIGNVWEWTASEFQPYPGFAADPYKEYSAPWFGDHKVLRGGCWATRSRLIRNTWRNFYTPDRRDVFAGFRTCALDP